MELAVCSNLQLAGYDNHPRLSLHSPIEIGCKLLLPLKILGVQKETFLSSVLRIEQVYR